MPTHVALLRAINVGGGGKIPMADLRRLVASLGHTQIATYLQTGNVVFTPAHGPDPAPGADPAPRANPAHDHSAALARELGAAITEAFGVRSTVIVLPREELAAVIGGNPYASEPNPRFVHGVFLPEEADDAARLHVAQALAAVAGQDRRDEATLRGRTLYLHTPDGFGASDLARMLLLKRSSPIAAGTARNWATVTKLLALCDD